MFLKSGSTAAIKASVSYESAFASVRKTVNATEEEFKRLSSQIKTMSTEVATSSDDIAEVVAIAGQLGIANDYLMNFSRTMIDLGNSTDIVASEAASTLAKFANIMNMDQSKFGNLGAALVDLGNKYATTESAIMNMAMRLAGAGHQVGLSEAQILGFAAALSSLGIEAEMGGSAFSKALVKMEVAAATGGEALDDFARVSGMTAEQFKAMWDADPAGAFQAFIEGLARMDEEGMSAIATLNEIGIVEVRLRDTLLRATNANELFTKTQQTANEAWEENTALVTEAGKRYATTESKLTNLKNKAVLFGQQIGDDLNPTIHNLIDGADDLLDRFMELDEAERMQIIRFAAIAASAGPALLAFGKITKGVGTIATAVGKFSTAVGVAGGGWKGFISVLGKSPAIWMAVAAAVIAGTIALADYVSGAKKAREALKGMQETAESWKETAADTFYGRSDGLGFFGMSEADFERNEQTAREWLDGLIKVWTDGQKESDEIVSEWTSSFKALTASTREELAEMKAAADEAGYTGVSDQLAADIATLDAMDAEIERLLKKRQNGYFSEQDQIRLQELIDTREAIEIKYKLSPADVDGFDTIRQKVEAEVARAQARGKEDADASVYENAMVAAAEGLAAVNAEIDEQYDKEYALIQLIEDSTERQAALDALNAKYNEDRRNAALEYAALLADIVMPVWEQENIQQAATDVDLLTQKLREYSAANETERPQLLEDLNELTAGMDEGAITEYIAMLTQIQSLLDSGMSEDEVQALFPEIDFSTALEQIASIQAFLNNREIELPGLTAMFGEALPEELLTIATDLDMTGAQSRWDEFAANPGAITTDAMSVGIYGYDLLAYRRFIAANPVEVQGIVKLGEVYENPTDSLNDPQTQFWQNGVQIPVEAVPSELLTADKVAILGEDGTLHVLIAPEVTGTQEAIDAISPLVDEVDQLGVTAAGMWAGVMPATTMDLIGSAVSRINSYTKTLDYNGWQKFWAALRGESVDHGVLDQSMKNDFSAETVAELSAYVGEVVSVIQQGKEVSAQDVQNLQDILTFLQGLDTTETGTHILEGVAAGMTQGGWETDAETVASNLEAALNLAFGIQSPSTRVKPVGENVSAGVGVGMTGYDFTADASSVATAVDTALNTALTTTTLTPIGTAAVTGLAQAMTSYSMAGTGATVSSNVRSAVYSSLTSTTLRSAGVNAMAGLKAGINAGRSGVISAMRSAARAAVNAAKSELKIHSPSEVFEDEVGVQTMRGFGVGVLKEAKEQARVIRNASRYLTGEAREGAIAYSSSDNRRTYNNNVSSTIQVAQMVIRDEHDIRSLAVEIATLTRRQQRGKGLRMA